jgi:hypothetical protein
MPYRIGGLDVSMAVATFPWRGVWHVRARLADGEAPVPGSAVRVELGDIVARGMVIHAGEHVGHAEVVVVGGNGGWGLDVEQRVYRADNGLPLGKLAEELATDAGELALVLPDVARRVPYAWTRPAGPASAAADALGVPWWVGTDGVTRFGARPAPRRTGLELGVHRIDLAARRATVGSAEDLLGAFLPGTVVAGPGLPEVRVRSAVVRVTDRSVLVDIEWGTSAIADLLDAHRAAVLAQARFYGLHVYKVTQQVGDRVDLDPVGGSDLPNQIQIDKAHGMAGARETCQAGSLALVAFRNGDPALPAVVAFLGAVPLEAELDATTELRLGPSVSGMVLAGGGDRPVAMGDATDLWAAAAHALLVQIVVALAPAPTDPLAIAAEAEALAYAAAALLGFQSDKLATR